jgi:iron complex transport system substrate-binding protein
MCCGWDHPRVFTEMMYMAKRCHPDKFEDLDVEKEGNEIFERFYGLDGLWTEFATNIGFI